MDIEVIKQAAKHYKSDILQPYDELMDIAGFDSIRAFADYFGGSTVYMPKLDMIFRRCLDREGIKEYNGGNYRALVRKYGMSESYWRKLLHNK